MEDNRKTIPQTKMLANDFAKFLTKNKIENEHFLQLTEQFVVVYCILKLKDIPEMIGKLYKELMADRASLD
jgi:hypothetical protein